MATERLNDVWLVGTTWWQGSGELLLQDNCFWRLWLYLKRLYFISSTIAYCISPYASFCAGLSYYSTTSCRGSERIDQLASPLDHLSGITRNSFPKFEQAHSWWPRKFSTILLLHTFQAPCTSHPRHLATILSLTFPGNLLLVSSLAPIGTSVLISSHSPAPIY